MPDSSSPPSEQASSYRLYRRLLNYALQYWGIFILAIIGMVIVAASSAAFPALMKPMMDGGFVERDPEVIRWVPLAIIGIFLVRMIGAFVSGYGMSLIGRNVIRELRRQMFSKLVVLPKRFYDNATSGEIISKFAYDVEQVANATTRAITVFIRDALTIVALIGWMFYLNVQLALVFMVITPVVTILILVVSRRFRKISKTIQHSMGDVSRIIEESIKGQLVVKIFGGRDYEIEQFGQINDRNRRQNLRLLMTQAISSPVVQLLVACALALIVYLATLESMRDSVTVGTFTSFLAAMSMLLPPVRSLTSVIGELQRGIAAAESVFEFIDSEVERSGGRYRSETIDGGIDFENLGFAYSKEKGDVLQDINLRIEAGQTVAFVGRSGSGKSTLVNLIPRFYDIERGSISIDGVNINDYDIDNLRSHIAYVGQDVVLFNDTIEHNIAYGAMKACTAEQIEAATRAAYAWDFIAQTENGMQTMVGERGVMLSGGQRQRIAIARALLKNAPILILDEATSALDNESERYIQASLEKLMQNRTTLVIAHRLSTIENADLIVVMDQGRIVERGRHEELLALNGHYANLHKMHFREDPV